ncbi:MAG: ATP-binding protein, partial [Bacteroidales bacterium]|nr:ATP-binding protein [Bacteroidales bacterium]
METQNIEYKESWRDEYLKWICGFANAQGGTLYIGMNDKGEVVGVDNAKRLLEDIPNKVSNILGIVVEVNILDDNGKSYLSLEVPPCSVPISFRGQYYRRSG